MKIFGFDVTWQGFRDASDEKALSPAQPSPSQTFWPFGSPWGWIRESFTGAWQQNVTLSSPRTLVSFAAVFACISLISRDISKMRVLLQKEKANGIWETMPRTSPLWPVLRKPNAYQNIIQFIERWITSKLLYGNTYVLKEYDNRGGAGLGIVKAMHVLDPSRVVPLIADDGQVYYEVKNEKLARLMGESGHVIFPAEDIIHDRMMTLWHPLIGIGPIFAAAASGTHGSYIQSSSSTFFNNMLRPSGVLKVPGKPTKEQLARVKGDVETAITGVANIGRLLLLTEGMEYDSLKIMPAVDAQLIEQLRFTGEDVARSFGVPPYKIGLGTMPAFNNMGALNQQYYSETLQPLIESLELCLNEGLQLEENMRTELDLTALLRLDPLSRADLNAKAIGAAYLAPNEARLTENLPPVKGGESPMMQQQNWNLAQLAERKGPADSASVAPPPATPAVEAPRTPAAEDEEEAETAEARELVNALLKRMAENPLVPELEYTGP